MFPQLLPVSPALELVVLLVLFARLATRVFSGFLLLVKLETNWRKNPSSNVTTLGSQGVWIICEILKIITVNFSPSSQLNSYCYFFVISQIYEIIFKKLFDRIWNVDYDFTFWSSRILVFGGFHVFIFWCLFVETTDRTQVGILWTGTIRVCTELGFSSLQWGSNSSSFISVFLTNNNII